MHKCILESQNKKDMVHMVRNATCPDGASVCIAIVHLVAFDNVDIEVSDFGDLSPDPAKVTWTVNQKSLPPQRTNPHQP